MNEQVHRLTEENEQLKKSMMIEGKLTEHETSKKTPLEYLTDEEEVVRETDWIYKKAKKCRKKHKAESSPEPVAEISLNPSKRTDSNRENPDQDQKAQWRKEKNYTSSTNPCCWDNQICRG